MDGTYRIATWYQLLNSQTIHRKKFGSGVMGMVLFCYSRWAGMFWKGGIMQLVTKAQCPECQRVFDLMDETDAEEFYYGHDCEAE